MEAQKIVSRDFSFVFGQFEAAEVCAVGSAIDSDILKAEVKDTYPLKGGEGFSVTLRFTIFADADIKSIEERIIKRYLGLGVKRR